LGAATILQFSLDHHRSANNYQEEIESLITNYSNNAFDMAFSVGDFGNVTAARNLPHFNKNDIKSRIKLLIQAQPTPLRYIAWKLTQLIGK